MRAPHLGVFSFCLSMWSYLMIRAFKAPWKMVSSSYYDFCVCPWCFILVCPPLKLNLHRISATPIDLQLWVVFVDFLLLLQGILCLVMSTELNVGVV